MTAWQLVLCVLDAVRHKDEYEEEMKLDLSSGRLVISVEFSLQPTYFIEERSVVGKAGSTQEPRMQIVEGTMRRTWAVAEI